jgi:aspartyl-tRNA(Asn)/glutamyl-tRNA(Gln) amidotransferase subunit A
MKSFATIENLREMLDKKEVSPNEVVSFYRERIAKYNPDLNAIIEVFNENDVDTKASGILNGIPGIIKDNICQKGQIASAGSKILENFRAPYDATVTTRLKSAGAPVLGRGNMDEFAMGSTGEFSVYGPSKNPWDTSRTPGGSSSGLSSCVAAGLVPWSIGTETGGSVRQPAAHCNLVGLYPTYGLFSRYGIVPFGSSLDQPGPLTRTVKDSAIITSILAGHDSKDSGSLPEPQRDYTRTLDGNLPEGLKIGVIRDSTESDGVDDEVKERFTAGLKELEKLGAKIKYVDIADLKYGIAVYFIVSRAEAASNLARIDGAIIGNRVEDEALKEMYIKTRTSGFGKEVKRRILTGNYVLSASHRDFAEKASHVRAMIRAEFEQAFSEVDVLTSPTAPTLPFELGDDMINDPLKVYMSDYFTVPNCVAGLPAISVPAGHSSNNLPVGIQFIGPRLSEELLFKIGYAFEQHTRYFEKTPANYE